MRVSDTDSSSGSLPGPSAVNALPNTNNKLLVNGPATNDALADVQITTSAIGRKALVLQGMSGQTGNLLECQTSAGSPNVLISSSGFTLTAPGLQVTSQITLNRGAIADTNTTLSNPITGVTSITAARTLTMPSSVGVGRFYLIVDESGSVSGVNTVTIAPNGGQTITGATVMTTANGVTLVYGTSTTAWFAVKLQ